MCIVRFAAYRTFGKRGRLEFNSSWWRLTLPIRTARARVCAHAPVGCVWITEEALVGITSITSLRNLQDCLLCMFEV